MKILLKSLVILTVVIMSVSCSKKPLEIGRDNPQLEIQKCMALSNKKRFEEAIECLEIFKSRFPQTEYSTQAEMTIADNYFDQKEYLLAADAYELYIKMHPTSVNSAYAYYRLGLSYFKESPKAIDRDQQYLEEAILYLRLSVINFPKSEYYDAAKVALQEAVERVAARIYYIGNFYFRTGEYISAVPRLIDLANQYPESPLAPKSLYKLVIASGRLKRVDDAKLFFSKLTLDYPKSAWTAKAEPKIMKYVKKYGSGKSSEPAHGAEGAE